MCIIVSAHVRSCTTLFSIKPGMGQMLQLQHTATMTNKLSSDMIWAVMPCSVF